MAPCAPAGNGDLARAPFKTARALEIEEIAAILNAYARAALSAQRADFGGFEIHAANGGQARAVGSELLKGLR